MAQLNLYPESYTGTNKCYRIIKPSTSYVWAFSGTNANTLVAHDSATATTYSETSCALVWNTGMLCYPLTLPTALPTGEYDLVIYDATTATLAVDTVIEQGYGFKWDANKQCLISPPKSIFTDKVA